MAHEKQGWQDALQAAKSKGYRPDDTKDPREQKKKAQLMYKRRRLDKDIKKLNGRKVIRWSDIEAIHEQHGVFVVESLQREDQESTKNA